MRVKIRISYIDAVFDFDDPWEALTFAKMVKNHYNESAGDEKEISISMTFIPDEIEQIGNDDDE